MPDTGEPPSGSGRSREEGFGYALRPDSTVLWVLRLGTSEERLARTLVSDGHKVALLHIE